MNMKTRAAVVLGAALLVAADTPQDERKKFEGTWEVVTGEFQGTRKQYPSGERLLVFVANKAVKKTKGVTRPEDEATYRLDPAKNPREIDFIPLRPAKGIAKDKQVTRGIYRWDRDRLTICFMPVVPALRPSGEIAVTESKRPTKFDSQQGILMTLKRLKK